MMFKKTKAFVATLMTVAVLAGFGANAVKTRAAENEVWLPAYLDADAKIDEKVQSWYDYGTGKRISDNEFFAWEKQYKTTDWAGTKTQRDGENNIVEYFGGDPLTTVPDTNIGSAMTVAENTTKLKIAQSYGNAGYRYIYPVRLDGLVMYLNLEQIKLGDQLRFSFGAGENTVVNEAYNQANHGNRGIAVELSQYNDACVNNNWIFHKVRSTENFGALSGITGDDCDHFFYSEDQGGKTFKFEFSVGSDGSVTMSISSHRNLAVLNLQKKSWTISAETVKALGMMDGDGNAWINVNAHNSAQNTDVYTRFAVKVEDANRTAYENGELKAMKNALSAYSAEAIQNGEVTAGNKAEWETKRKTVVDSLPKLRISDKALLAVEEKLAAADEALETKYYQSLINEKTFYAVGASIRLKNDGNGNGIRFVFRLEKSAYEILKDSATFNALVIPADKVGSSELSAQTPTVQNTDIGDIWEEESADGNMYMRAIVYLFNIPEASYARGIAARAYLTVDGRTFYTDTIIRSITSVAQSAYNDEEFTKKELLTAYLPVVSFDGKGAEGTMLSITVTEGAEYILPDCTFTVPEGKAFGGWKIGEKVYAAGEKISFVGGIKVTAEAVWTDFAAEQN